MNPAPPKRRYLLVDDNRALAENLAEIICDDTSADSSVDVASSGSEALALAERTRYDAMLTDMRMPVMDGAELIHRVRRVDPGLPAVLFTAYSGDRDLLTARREGLLAMLAKPVDLPQLLHLLRNAKRNGMVTLVEDDLALSDNLSELLRARGFTTVTADSVLETKRIGNVSPFAALVDLRVPGGPFGEAMRLLRERFPNIPLLVISAHTDEPPPVPAFAIYKKPFDTPSLLDEVESLYRRHVV